MAEHSSFASASCYFWDWEANNGLGGWAQMGLLNNETGCSTTKASLIAMFLDVTEPLNQYAVAFDRNLNKITKHENALVAALVAAYLLAASIFHYWAFKQDCADKTKPVEMKQLGDGINGPR